MSSISLITILSGIILVFLIALYRYERKHGMRFFESARMRLDFAVLKVHHTLRVRMYRMSRYVFHQIVRYFLHTFLTKTLHVLTRLERKVKFLVQSNKARARKINPEKGARNKLEEVAIHKLEVALTEEEKIRHKEKLLNGM